IKTLKFLAAKNPNIFFSSVYLEIIKTEIFLKLGVIPNILPIDIAKLLAYFIVWASQPKV
ncbi:uncharacterized protein K441DRAFT_596003, partial [Cenococcum geophilum 1.58]